MSDFLSKSEQKEYNSFFASIGVISDFTEKTESRLVSKIAPRFNYFYLFAPNENRISFILADLLNPAGRHGQGDKFLSEFFKIILSKPFKMKDIKCFQNFRDVAVQTEAPTKKGRRIDLLIKTDKWVVGIENKPWADDQKNQLIDYYKHVKYIAGKDKNYAMIYLSGRDTPPSDLCIKAINENSGKNGKLILMRYCGQDFYDPITTNPIFKDQTISSDLLAWLKRCKDICEPSHVKTFLEHFSAYVEKYFSDNEEDNMSNTEKNIISFIKKYPDRVKLAMNINRTALINSITDDFIAKLRNKFKTTYEEKFQQDLEIEDDLINHLSKKRCPRIDFFCRSWPKADAAEDDKPMASGNMKLTLTLEKDAKGPLYWGIRSYTDWLPGVQREKLAKRMIKEFGKKRKNVWWPWYCNTEPWENFKDPDVLVKLANEEQSAAFIDETVIKWMKTIEIINGVFENNR